VWSVPAIGSPALRRVLPRRRTTSGHEAQSTDLTLVRCGGQENRTRQGFVSVGRSRHQTPDAGSSNESHPDKWLAPGRILEGDEFHSNGPLPDNCCLKQHK
jgi:hypothetical protein